jgi:hypothetical protein
LFTLPVGEVGSKEGLTEITGFCEIEHVAANILQHNKNILFIALLFKVNSL